MQDKKSKIKDWKDREYHFDTGISGDSKLKQDNESDFEFQKRLVKENFKKRRADKLKRRADKLSRKANNLDSSSSIEDIIFDEIQGDEKKEKAFFNKGPILSPEDRVKIIEENKFLQSELNNEYGFVLNEDGKIGPNTQSALNLKNDLESRGWSSHEIYEYNEHTRLGFPTHLLLEGDRELYEKWKNSRNPLLNLTDEEYKKVYPDAKTNKEYFDQFKNKASNWHDKQVDKGKDTINRIWDFLKGQ